MFVCLKVIYFWSHLISKNSYLPQNLSYTMHWHSIHHLTCNLLLNSPSDCVCVSKISLLAQILFQGGKFLNFFIRIQNIHYWFISRCPCYQQGKCGQPDLPYLKNSLVCVVTERYSLIYSLESMGFWG